MNPASKQKAKAFFVVGLPAVLGVLANLAALFAFPWKEKLAIQQTILTLQFLLPEFLVLSGIGLLAYLVKNDIRTHRVLRSKPFLALLVVSLVITVFSWQALRLPGLSFHLGPGSVLIFAKSGDYRLAADRADWLATREDWSVHSATLRRAGVRLRSLDVLFPKLREAVASNRHDLEAEREEAMELLRLLDPATE